MLIRRTLVMVLIVVVSPIRASYGGAISRDPGADGPIIVFGNSITEGYIEGEIDTLSRYSNLLRQDLSRLGRENRVINEGRGGDTSRDGYLRLDEDVLRYDPSVVTILFGLNDLRLSGDGAPGTDIDDFRLYLGAIVDRVRETGASPVLLSLVPIIPDRFYETHDRSLYEPLGGVEAIWGDYDRAVRSVGEEYGLTVVDLQAGFSDSLDVLIGNGGTHPNERGHRVIANRLLSPVISGLEAESGGERNNGEGLWDLRVYPNPFGPEAGELLRIAYHIAGDGMVTIEVYGLTGKRMVVPVRDVFRVAGGNTEFWDGAGRDGRPLPAGIYLVKIDWKPVSGAKSISRTRKIAILR